MTTIVRIAIAVVISIFLTSCGFDIQIGDFGTGVKGNGNVVTDSRMVTEDFTEVSSSEGLEVFVTQAEDFSIEVEADDNVIDLIETDITNGKLRIRSSKNIGNATKIIYVTLPQVTALAASSGSQLKTKNSINAKTLEIDASSGAVMNLELVSNEMDTDASSGASLRITGSVNDASIDVSSGAHINAKDLQTVNCNAEASSGGSIKVQVEKSLVADASSGGSISYSGEPSVETKKSVSGSVHQY